MRSGTARLPFGLVNCRSVAPVALSLGEGFNGLLPWGNIDNRPFPRCMSGYGLCLWRLGRFEEAERVFDRMLWLNPTGNQGARFLIGQVRAREIWEDGPEEG